LSRINIPESDFFALNVTDYVKDPELSGFMLDGRMLLQRSMYMEGSEEEASMAAFSVAEGETAAGGANPMYAVSHEYGHAVRNWLEREHPERLSQFMDSFDAADVSQYARFNDHEKFAEIFASWVHAEGDARLPHLELVANLLEDVR
jgi:hypothetical protein